MKLQRLGGYAAIASICAYLAVLAISILRLSRYGDLKDPVKMMAVILAAQGDLYLVYLLFIISYIFLLIMVLALHERMQSTAPYLTRLMLIAASTATAMLITEAIIFIRNGVAIATAQDISAYKAFTGITDGLHYTAGHMTAWTVLLTGCAILRTRALSRVLGWVLLLTGILWLPRFAVPQLELVPALLACLGAVWIGIALLREKQPRIGK